MGLLETLEGLDLSDEVKQQIISEHEGELGDGQTELAKLRATAKKTKVNGEVEALKSMGFAEAPGLLKFVRRVMLSDDEQPGIVLLSDADMELSGDDITDAKNREELSVAGAIRKFIELMPKTQEGKLDFSDMVSQDGSVDRPPAGDEPSAEDKTREARERLAKHAGRPVTERTRRRYDGGMHLAGGNS